MRPIAAPPKFVAPPRWLAGTDHDNFHLSTMASRLKCSNPVLDFLMLNWLDHPILADLAMLVLRVVTASLIVHHGLQKTGDPNGFADGVIAAYFSFLPGPPLFWTYLAATFELVGSFCLVVGLFVRPAAALLAGTMVNAIAFQLMKFGLQGYPFGQNPSGPAYTFEPSLAFLAITTHIFFAGPGRFALQPHFPSLEFMREHTHWVLIPLKELVFEDLSLLVLRVVTASLMVHHGLQKTDNPDGFAENVIAAYFSFLPGPPLFWTYLAASFELGGSFCITVGLFVRPASALLAGTMVNAVAFQLMKVGLQNYPFGQAPSGPAYTFEPSLTFLAVCARLVTAGPGQFGLQTGCRPVRQEQGGKSAQGQLV
jgi:putative oxidoreductase